jgi:Xaa-Pro aminopeptidase
VRPCRPATPFSTARRRRPPLATNVVIAVGNCGLYTGPWGVRVEDTVVVKPEGPLILTDFVRKLEM